MNLAKVIGTIWATQKDPQLNNLKMLLIQPLDSNEKERGKMERNICLLFNSICQAENLTMIYPLSRIK